MKAGALIRDKMERGLNNSILNKSGEEFDPQTEADVGAQYIIETGLQLAFPTLQIVGEEPLQSLESYVERHKNINLPTTDQLQLNTTLFTLETTPKSTSPAQTEATQENPTATTTTSTEQCIPNTTINIAPLLNHLKTNPIPQNLLQLDPDHLVVYVDPLDGTSQFTKGHKDHVTTLISITYHGYALGGIIYYPFTNYCLFGGIALGCFDGYCALPSDEDAPLDQRNVVANTDYSNLKLPPTPYNQYTVLAKHPFFRTFCQDFLQQHQDKIQTPLLTINNTFTPPHSPTTTIPSPECQAIISTTPFLTPTPPEERTIVTTSSHWSVAIFEYFHNINIDVSTYQSKYNPYYKSDATTPEGQKQQLYFLGGAGHKGAHVMLGFVHAYCYPITGTKRWDIGVLDGLLFAYGGQLTNIYGELYTYCKDQSLVNDLGVICTLNQHQDYVLPRPAQ